MATTIVEYLVDGRGRPVGKRVNGVLERGWLWRGQLQPVAELDGAGNVVARFVYAGGVNVPALMVTPTATYRLVTDHLGSVRRVVDVATGAVVQELEFDAWGRVLLDTSPGLQPFGFAGGLYDPDTGLVRFGARDYDAATGRWTAKDPIRFSGGSNFYEYSRSSPGMRRDPSGLDSVLDWVDELVLFGARIVLPALPSVGMACARAAPYVAAVGGVGATIWQTTELVNEWDTDTFTDAICDDFGACVDEDDDGCEQEWEDAYEFCERELAKPAPSRRLTGGYTTVGECARGHVSERCLGNSIDWGGAK